VKLCSKTGCVSLEPFLGPIIFYLTPNELFCFSTIVTFHLLHDFFFQFSDVNSPADPVRKQSSTDENQSNKDPAAVLF
jgi:hypothetical protein